MGKRNVAVIFAYGVLARLISFCTPIRKRCWVFGADNGISYREGSKYLFEYMLKNHPEYESVFVTQSPEVYEHLKGRGLPCEMNLSLRGVIVVARAECVFTTQIAADVLFAYKKRGRRFFYLVHGQPLKIAQLALAKTRVATQKSVTSLLSVLWGIRAVMRSYFVCDHDNGYSEFVSATSGFLKHWMEKDFDGKTLVKVLGMPRNDALFQPERMKAEKWIDGTEGKFVITYMPTHRKYGRGEFSPTPFAKRPDVQKWMDDNGVVLIVKNHPTMLVYKDYTPLETNSIRDITDKAIDPMTAVYKSDVVITDYSSVWMDYLLLRRPILFYIYDNFVKDDVGVHYDVKKENIGRFCYSEDELFDAIKAARTNYDAMRPSEEVVRKFHSYVDGNSCDRYFREIANVKTKL